MTYWHEYRNLFRSRSVLLLLSSEVINSIGSTLTFLP